MTYSAKSIGIFVGILALIWLLVLIGFYEWQVAAAISVGVAVSQWIISRYFVGRGKQ